jgi:ferric-dicitrate binding protein FerR (iron transport regulator)
MKKLIALSLSGCLAAASTSSAIDLKQSKLTQVVNDVQIISAADQTKKNATVNDVFNMPDILRTGASSRAELVAADETVTRVGANTIFSFDPANRTIDLKQGSLLFHSPHGKGGGTIHTGSATASVLGTTLIVTTTPNGGMKVLDLEGTVQVNFKNHLKQKLNPGQMTFILPGGTNFAPIINFRLDELTRISLLVHGFNQPLPSLAQIDKQAFNQSKLIKTGRATDTGLLVGENATPSQVEVLDANTVQTSVGSAGLNTALGADATINQPSLTGATVPTPPKHIFPDQTFALPNNAYFGGRKFTGFLARNIFINTPALNALTVDVSAYAGASEFDLVAAKNLTLAGTVVFAGFSPQHSIFFSLIAGNQILFAPNASVTANIANFELAAAGAMTLSDNNVFNGAGNTRFAAGADILVDSTFVYALGNVAFSSAAAVTLAHSAISADSASLTAFGGALSLDSVALNANSFAVLNAAGNVTLNNSSLDTSPGSGLISINSKAGSVNISGTAIQTHFLTVNSGDGILLNGTGGSFTATGDGATANLTAANAVNVNSLDLGSLTTLNVSANTVTLDNVNLPKITNVGTLTGNVNVNGPVTYGWFNLINSRWQNTPITSASQVTLASGPGSTAGIYSYAR